MSRNSIRLMAALLLLLTMVWAVKSCRQQSRVEIETLPQNQIVPQPP